MTKIVAINSVTKSSSKTYFLLSPIFPSHVFYFILQIDELMKDFRLTDETYEKIMKLLNEEMDRGLGKVTHDSATVKMFPTYVRNITDGTGICRFQTNFTWCQN